jgi:uncharacterized protein (DUF1330 family)
MGFGGVSLSLPRPPKTNLLRYDLSHDEPFAANPNPTAPRFRQSPVYSLHEADVIDPEGYKSNFLKVVAPKLEKHSIKYRVRGGAPKALVAEPPKNRLVITQAKDMETLMAFWSESKFQNVATKYANGIRRCAAEGASNSLYRSFCS